MSLNETGAFIVPHYNDGNEIELKWFGEALNSIKLQTDNDWKIIVIDDASTSEKAISFLKQMKKYFSEKMEVIFLSENLGPGNARNIGIKRAFELGCPFVLYLDQDDISHPERLEVTRKIFNRQQEAGVVYSTFRVIDDNSDIVPKNKIIPSIQEILDSHVNNPPQGKNVWIRIATETGYINLTSSTSVRTDAALRCPFPIERVSEDYYTWLTYSASGYQFVYTPLIPSGYRIPQIVNGSRSRSSSGGTHTFNMIKSIIDMRSIQAAADIAYKNGSFTDKQIKEIKVRFCLKKSESMAIDGEKEISEDYIYRARDIDNELTEKLLKEKESMFYGGIID